MVRSYQCSGCGSAILYNPGTNENICPKCGKKEPISALNANLLNGTFAGKIGPESSDTSGTGAGTVKCPACGGPLPTDTFTSATVCSYCGSSAIVESQLEGDYRPSRIVPFAFGKAEAQKKFRAWSKKGKLTPTEFKSNAIMDRVKATYVPFWLFDYEVDVDMVAKAEKHRKEKNGNVEREITENYDVQRNTTAKYTMVPYAASGDMPAEAMACVEPYDYKPIDEFSMPYLNGFTAEKYVRTDIDMRAEVRKELEEVAYDVTEDTIDGYDKVEVTAKSAVFRQERTEFVLMPAYSLDYTYGGKKFPIYMNGQTGKISGKLPTSKGKGFAYFAIAFGIVALICALISIIFIHKGDFGAAFSGSWIWAIIAFIIGGIAFLVTLGKQSGPSRYARRNYMENKNVQVISKTDRLVNTVTKATTVEEKK